MLNSDKDRLRTSGAAEKSRRLNTNRIDRFLFHCDKPGLMLTGTNIELFLFFVNKKCFSFF